jgi:ABC-2 type transport system permease protein
MYLSFNISNLAMKFINNIELINKILSNVGFLINSFMLVVSQNSFKDLLIFIFTNVISIVIFIAIFNKTYVKIVQKLKVEKVNTKYIEKDHKSKNCLTTLVVKELKMYFSIPIYILNTSLGVAIMLFASIATLFYDKNVIYKLMEIDSSKMPIYLLLFPLVAFTTAVSNTAACSISIEGKNFWILKTMPIKTKDIFLSKIILNMLIVLPLTIVSIIIFGFSLKLTIIQTLIVIALAIIINIACSMYGIIVNLKFPRLDFVSYTLVVKQSVSSLLGILIPMALIFGFVSIYLALNISIEIYILIIFALLLFIIMVQYYMLKKWGIKRFNEIN